MTTKLERVCRWWNRRGGGLWLLAGAAAIVGLLALGGCASCQTQPNNCQPLDFSSPLLVPVPK